jgi:succinate dehydrogenase / fumarate reductase iron-sulfur subunit
LVPKHDADGAFDAATCGVVDLCCSCKTHQLCYLYLLRVSQYALLPQGKVEAADRVMNMVAQMDAEGFGNCTNTGACEVRMSKVFHLKILPE